MAIKISGTTVINDSRNIENIGIATATTFSGQVNAGVGTITTLTSTNVNATSLNATGVVTATTFSGQVNAGVGTITTLTSTTLNVTQSNPTNLNVTGVSTLGTVEVASGIVTATTGIVTYYGDGQYLTGVAAAGSGGSNDITSNLFF